MSILNPLRSNNQSSSHIACETFQRVFHLNYPKFIPEKRDEPQSISLCVCVCVCVMEKRAESRSWKGSPGIFVRGIAPWSRIRTRSNPELCTWEPPKKKNQGAMWVVKMRYTNAWLLLFLHRKRKWKRLSRKVCFSSAADTARGNGSKKLGERRTNHQRRINHPRWQ